jgi:hypothetical protein
MNRNLESMFDRAWDDVESPRTGFDDSTVENLTEISISPRVLRPVQSQRPEIRGPAPKSPDRTLMDESSLSVGRSARLDTEADHGLNPVQVQRMKKLLVEISAQNAGLIERVRTVQDQNSTLKDQTHRLQRENEVLHAQLRHARTAYGSITPSGETSRKVRARVCFGVW